MIPDYRKPIFFSVPQEEICSPRGEINLDDHKTVTLELLRLQSIQRDVDKNPNDLFSQTRLAEYLLDLRFFKDAEKVGLKAFHTSPIEELRENKDFLARNLKELGRAALCNHDFERSIRAYRGAIKSGENSPDVTMGLGLAEYYHQDFGQAIQTLRKVASPDPSFRRNLFYLALSEHARGEYPNAISIFKRLIVKIKEEHPLYFLEKALKKHPERFPFSSDTMESFRELQRTVDSAEIDSIPNDNSREFCAFFIAGFSEELRKKKNLPIEIESALCKMNEVSNPLLESSLVRKELASTYYYLGIAYRDANKPKEALRAFNHALQINPRLTESLKAKELIEEGLARR